VIDRVCDRWYRRWGPRYFDYLLALVLALVIGLTAVNSLAGVLYANGSTADWLPLALVSEGLMVIAAAVWIPYVRRRFAPVRRWTAGQRSPADAEAAWKSVVTALPRTVATGAVIITLFGEPAVAYGVGFLDLSWWMFPIGAAAVTIGDACGAVLVYLFAEALLAPIARELSAARPLAVEGPARGVSMSWKLLLLPPVASFWAAGVAVGVVAGVGSDKLGPAGRVGLGLGVALAISLTFSFAGTLLLRRSLVGPVDALVDAAGRVGAGDLTVTVPALAADELGALTQSFNEMTGELRRMTADLRASQARIVASSDAARRRVERDLHDGAQQHLVLLNLRLGRAERGSAAVPEVREAVAQARVDLESALAELRDLAHGIYPSVLTNEGLAAALSEAAERCAIPARVDCEDTSRHPPELEAAVYFCCLEALQNAAKHAGEGAAAAVRLQARPGELRFEVSDDGVGFEPSINGAGTGLQNMADRIGALGGTVSVASKPGEGTSVVGAIPVAS
jgi:signal transduction histidine kinase